MTRPKAYSYTRMSTLEQLHGDSRRRQIARTERFAAERGLELVERFDDWGVSGYYGQNAELGELKRFRDAIDAGEIERGSYLVVESMDRLSRQKVSRALTLLTEIVNKGIILVTLDDGIEYSEETIDQNSFSLIIALASMARAHEESRRKSGLLSEVWGEKKRQARESGKVISRQIPKWLSVTEDGEIIPVPERVKVVREIFELCRDGWGAYSIARHFNQRGEEPWSAKENALWRESYIKKILKNRAVLGEYQPHTTTYDSVNGRRRVPEGDPVKDYYPSIISPLLFQEANSASARRRLVGRGRKGSEYANLFSGLLKCTCGGGYRYINKGKPPKGGQYLQCSISHVNGNCSAPAIRYALVEDVVLKHVESLDIGRVLGGERHNKKVEAKRLALIDLNEQRDENARQIDRLLEAIKTTETPPNSLVRQLAQVEESIERIDAEISAIEKDLDELVRIDPAKHQALLERLLNQLRSRAGEQDLTRRALVAELQRMLTKVVIRRKKREPWELVESDPEWQSTYKVTTESELEKLCEKFPFEISIHYRNGSKSRIDPLDGAFFRTTASRKMQDLKFLNKV